MPLNANQDAFMVGCCADSLDYNEMQAKYIAQRMMQLGLPPEAPSLI